MDQTQSDPWADLRNYIHTSITTAVEATRLGMAPDGQLTIEITTANIINAVRNPEINHNLPKGRHR
jgi:hypothetical protein